MNEEINTNLLCKIKNYLTTLENISEIEDYKHLGYTLKSIIKVTQTALITEIESQAWIDHDKWDIYNMLNLIKNLFRIRNLNFWII